MQIDSIKILRMWAAIIGSWTMWWPVIPLPNPTSSKTWQPPPAPTTILTYSQQLKWLQISTTSGGKQATVTRTCTLFMSGLRSSLQKESVGEPEISLSRPSPSSSSPGALPWIWSHRVKTRRYSTITSGPLLPPTLFQTLTYSGAGSSTLRSTDSTRMKLCRAQVSYGVIKW